MSLEVILILFGVGIAAGILSGLFGVGGGIIIVPSLIAVYSFINFNSPYSVHIAIATSLFTIIFTSISSSFKHYRNGNVILSAALLIGFSSVVTVYLFSKAAIALPGETLKKIFSVLLILIAVKMLFDKKGKDEGNTSQISEKDLKFNKWLGAAIGVLSGTIAAFSGLGGGIFVVPLMHYLMKFSFKKAIGTSSAAILLTSIAGVLSYFFNMPSGAVDLPYAFGMVDTRSALPIIAASIPFAQIGVYINKRTHHYLLTKLFAVFILIVSARMIFF
ncbi:MAG: sulfite exporter TauE/SafE family protein [Chlorobi bacterium]|nr:sulfite exporter TauE/SafE family protein [Chlorobiota bacterium]MCI0716994.1 sulfite exporter TauE/SafE family protein [Chlorobiota bacterium]